MCAGCAAAILWDRQDVVPPAPFRGVTISAAAMEEHSIDVSRQVLIETMDASETIATTIATDGDRALTSSARDVVIWEFAFDRWRNVAEEIAGSRPVK